MAYNKKNWQDNVSDITAAELNRMEQGIYDNSIVVEAIKDTINPTDTETYKTAELTEGQINDVIGVNDIIIKGQTSQDGTPTPSAPININVVSGSNIIKVSNKNLFSYANDFLSKTANGITIKRRQNGTYSYVGTATGDTINIWFNGEYNNWNTQLIENALFKISSGKTITAKDVRVFILYEDLTKITLYEGMSLTLAQNAYIMAFRAIQAVNGTTYNKVCYPQLEIGSTATTYEPHQGKELPLDLGPIELCKIGDYQDYFYKSGSKWYLHKEVNRIKLDGSENISTPNTGTANWYYRVIPSVIKEVNSQTNQICNYYNNVEIFNSNTTQGIMMVLDGAAIRIRYGTEDTVSNFKTWLSNNNVILYCQLKTSTDTEITNPTLISQLEAIYNAPLYEQTNITQTNNDLPMVLDITACKDNINGIKAFIRR